MTLRTLFPSKDDNYPKKHILEFSTPNLLVTRENCFLQQTHLKSNTDNTIFYGCEGCIKVNLRTEKLYSMGCETRNLQNFGNSMLPLLHFPQKTRLQPLISINSQASTYNSLWRRLEAKKLRIKANKISQDQDK